MYRQDRPLDLSRTARNDEASYWRNSNTSLYEKASRRCSTLQTYHQAVELYLEKRRRNNVSARKSRQIRKSKELAKDVTISKLTSRVQFLEEKMMTCPHCRVLFCNQTVCDSTTCCDYSVVAYNQNSSHKSASSSSENRKKKRTSSSQRALEKEGHIHKRDHQNDGSPWSNR